jgi:hypothetical protein
MLSLNFREVNAVILRTLCKTPLEQSTASNMPQFRIGIPSTFSFGASPHRHPIAGF